MSLTITAPVSAALPSARQACAMLLPQAHAPVRVQRAQGGAHVGTMAVAMAGAVSGRGGSIASGVLALAFTLVMWVDTVAAEGAQRTPVGSVPIAPSLFPARPAMPGPLPLLPGAAGPVSPVTASALQLAAGGEDGIALYDAGAFARALEPLSRAAEDGDPEAQFRLARMYLEGQAVPRDPVKARGLFEQAAESGHAPSLNELGRIHLDGLGTPRDPLKAMPLLQEAAAAGVVAADHNLALLFERGGMNLPKDLPRALMHYRRAAAQGHPQAQQNLALLLLQGRGGPPNPGEAQTLLESAAEQNLSSAMYNLGVLHSEGGGGPVDRILAAAWLTLAADRDNALAFNTRIRLTQRMTPQERAAVAEKAAQLEQRIAAARIRPGQATAAKPARTAAPRPVARTTPQPLPETTAPPQSPAATPTSAPASTADSAASGTAAVSPPPASALPGPAASGLRGAPVPPPLGGTIPSRSSD